MICTVIWIQNAAESLLNFGLIRGIDAQCGMLK
jgi:hypothetical protein